jgi:hypothetical protein
MLNKVKATLKSRSFHRIKSNHKFIIISAVTAIIALSWSAKGWLVSPANATPMAHTAWAPNSESGQDKGKDAPSTIQVESIILKPTGFEPKEFSRPATPFVLAIHNRTAAFDASFELLREDGRKVHDVKGPKGAVRPAKIIDLPPGTYLLKETNHPEWTCRIVLTR